MRSRRSRGRHRVRDEILYLCDVLPFHETVCGRLFLLPPDFSVCLLFICEKGRQHKRFLSAFFSFLFDLRVAIWNACDELQAIRLEKNMGDYHVRSVAGTVFCVPTFFSLLFVIRMAMGNAYDELKAILWKIIWRRPSLLSFSYFHIRSSGGNTKECVPTFFSLLFVIRMAMGNAYDKLKAI